jgi:2-dehydro-3-deoxyphosphogluconate aldolase/(4S)-4-hydroxy-2-oxoglutarate aldolase
MLKIFPIGPLGLEYFKAITGPLDQMKFMCNGGMSDQNVGEFLRAGAVCCGLVGWLTGDGTWPHDKILARAKTLRRIVNEVRTGQKQAVEI